MDMTVLFSTLYSASPTTAGAMNTQPPVSYSQRTEEVGCDGADAATTVETRSVSGRTLIGRFSHDCGGAAP